MLIVFDQITVVIAKMYCAIKVTVISKQYIFQLQQYWMNQKIYYLLELATLKNSYFTVRFAMNF